MEELIFKNNQCEFIVNGDFNIHLERESSGDILIQQKTSGEIFADTDILHNALTTFDCDFTGYVYPKTIRLKSFSKVIKGYVTENA